MQDVELAKRQLAGANFLHGGLIFATPRIGEFEPVEGMAELDAPPTENPTLISTEAA